MSGSIDASIPLRAGQGVTPIANPLTQYGDFVHLQSALNQNALFPGQQQLQQQQITHGDQTTQSNATNLALQTRNAVYAHLAPLIAAKDPSLDLVTQALGTAAANGFNVNPTLDRLHATFPVAGTPEDTPEGRRTWLKGLVGATLAPSEQVAAATPQHGGFVSDGQNMIPYTVGAKLGPNAGAVSTAGAGAPVPIWPSRSELNGRAVIGYDPVTKGPIYGPTATVTPPGLGGPASEPSPFGTGRLPSSLRNPSAAPPPVTGVVTGAPGPAQTAALERAGGTSADAFNDITSQGVQAKSQGALLDNMLGDTAQFTTGPGTEGIKNFKATLQRFAPGIASGFGVTPESIAANESFDKFAAQLANAQGAGSDARLAVNQSANPSSHLTPAGVDMIMRQLRGNSDYLGARSKLAAAYPDKTDRSGFEASVGAHLDPRVFQYDRMTPEQKATFFNNMKDQSTFMQAHKWAADHNLIGGNNAN